MTEKLQIAVFIWAGVFQILFVAIYARLPWWSNFIGRALFLMSSSLMLMLTVTVANVYVDYAAEEWVEVGIFATVAVAVTYQYAAMQRHRHKTREGMTP